MTIAFYIVAGLTALVFLAAGAMKLIRPKEALASSGLAWVEDFEPGTVKLIGLAELLGAIGVLLPVLTGILPVLSPIAGLALTALMIGATVTHVRRHEPPVTIALAALAISATVLSWLLLSQG